MLEAQELEVLNKLAIAFNEFSKLEEYHSSDREEFMSGIHRCQNIVMARIAVRAHPAFFKRPKEE